MEQIKSWSVEIPQTAIPNIHLPDGVGHLGEGEAAPQQRVLHVGVLKGHNDLAKSTAEQSIRI